MLFYKISAWLTDPFHSPRKSTPNKNSHANSKPLSPNSKSSNAQPSRNSVPRYPQPKAYLTTIPRATHPAPQDNTASNSNYNSNRNKST